GPQEFCRHAKRNVDPLAAMARVHSLRTDRDQRQSVSHLRKKGRLMCDLTMALTIGSTLLGAAGAVQQGQATAAASEYNAKVGDMNARLSERRARDAIERGAAEEQQKRMEVQKIMGDQRVAAAANGVDLTFG